MADKFQSIEQLLAARGNINLKDRPQVRNPDDSISTIRSIGVNIDGEEILIPTVSEDGRIMSDDEAVDQYRRTGRHLGKYGSPEEATEAAKAMSQQQADYYLDE